MMSLGFVAGVTFDPAVTLVFNTLQKAKSLYSSTQTVMISGHVQIRIVCISQ